MPLRNGDVRVHRLSTCPLGSGNRQCCTSELTSSTTPTHTKQIAFCTCMLTSTVSWEGNRTPSYHCWSIFNVFRTRMCSWYSPKGVYCEIHSQGTALGNMVLVDHSIRYHPCCLLPAIIPTLSWWENVESLYWGSVQLGLHQSVNQMPPCACTCTALKLTFTDASWGEFCFLKKRATTKGWTVSSDGQVKFLEVGCHYWGRYVEES